PMHAPHVTVVLVLAACVIVQPAVAQHPVPPGGAVAGHGVPTSITGKVVETMNSGGYTYVLVDSGAKKIWAAAPQFPVAVGDQVVVPEEMPMRDYHSKTLGRTFDLVYFVSEVQVAGGQAARDQVAAPHGAVAQGGAAAVDLSNIQKATGGYTVAELFA